jgi:hypothetical protein
MALSVSSWAKHVMVFLKLAGSRANILPGAAMIGLIGLAGQTGYNLFSETQRSESNPRRSVMQQLTESKWAPLKALSDQQYEEMLQQKLLKIDVELSMIDEKIATLKAVKDDTPPAGPRDGVSTP